MEKTRRTQSYWQDFVAATGCAAGDYDVSTFGDGAALCDELTALTLAGTKRATASLLRDFEAEGAPVPRVGTHVVSVDADGEPRLIWRNVAVDIKPVHAITEADAAAEGEGDGSLASWLDGHRRYWMRQAEREGFVYDDDLLVVFERFVVVWPPEAADLNGT